MTQDAAQRKTRTTARRDGRYQALLSATGILLLALASSSGRAQTDTIQTNVPALKEVYRNDFRIGCLLSYRNIGFADDPPVPGQSKRRGWLGS